MMGSLSRFWSVLSGAALCGALMLTAPPTAEAEAPAEQAAPAAPDDQKELARAAYAAGRQAFSARQFEEAVRQYKRADSILPKPLLHFYIAQAQAGLEQWVEARESLRKFAATSEEAASQASALAAELELAIAADSVRRARERVEDAIVKANGSTPPPRSAQRYALGTNVRDVPVQIASNPPGAAVFIDDVELGSIGNTPLDTRLFVGPHLIAIELPNKKPVRRVVQITVPQAGEEIPRISFDLEPLMVTVAVTSEPASATVWYFAADGARRRLGMGQFKGELPAGNCTFLLQQGGRDRRIPFVIAPVADGSETPIRLSLNETEAARGAPVRVGQLRVVMDGLRGDLFVDGAKVGSAPTEIVVDLPPGPHKIELRRPGHLTWIQTIKVGPDAETVLYPSDMPED
jgi:tetratricopeptide (TPR) repeat protein